MKNHPQTPPQRSWPSQNIGWRFYAIIACLLVGLFILLGRMIVLNIVQRDFLLQQSKARIIRLIDIPAYRGMLLDRNHIPLAISAPVDSVWMNPQQLTINREQQAQLLKILTLSPIEFEQKAQKSNGREFVYLARRLPPETAAQIKALKIQGVFFQREYRRFYPSGEVTAQILGITNIDDKGQEGLELAYNDWLQGIPGKRRVLKDRYGQIVANLGVARLPQEGRDLTLSIDSRIQFFAYHALKEALPKFNAEWGSIIVLDIQTGEILAMANAPSFNPNARTSNHAHYRNHAAIDTFEPGSTMKTFSIAAILASGRYTPNSMVNTGSGSLTLGKHIIQDDSKNGIINVTQVLQKSSNIGVAKLTLSLPPENWWAMISPLGLGERTTSGFPGEAAGVLLKNRIQKPVELATMSYGYGLSTTALQLTQAYAVIGAQGVKRPLTFLKMESPPSGIVVMSAPLCRQMLTLLKAVAEGGSGLKARIPGYQVGGKTGTAYIATHQGYDKSHYTSSFIGIAPLTQPRLVVSVVLHGVQGNIHFGAQVSAPIFAEIMSKALRYLSIPPDSIEHNS